MHIIYINQKREYRDGDKIGMGLGTQYRQKHTEPISQPIRQHHTSPIILYCHMILVYVHIITSVVLAFLVRPGALGLLQLRKTNYGTSIKIIS